MRKLLNCGTTVAALVGLFACGVLMSIFAGKWDSEKSKEKPMDSKMYAIYNITLGLSLAVMFYAVIFNALKSIMEVGRAPLKMMIGLVVGTLFWISSRVMNKWQEDGDSEGYRDKKFTSIWEMWVLLIAPYFIFFVGVVAVIYTPSFCLGA